MEVDGDGATSVGLLDVLIYVVPHLSSAAQLATLACVCKESAALVSADASWTVICEREWRVITSQLAPRSFSQWRELFRALKARNTPVTTVLAFAASVSSVDRREFDVTHRPPVVLGSRSPATAASARWQRLLLGRSDPIFSAPTQARGKPRKDAPAITVLRRRGEQA